MSSYLHIGFPAQGTSFSKSSRRARRVNRKYRKAALQAEIEAQAYHRTVCSHA